MAARQRARALALTLAVALTGVATTACARRELTVIEASYGANCRVPAGNVTGSVGSACDGRSGCAFVVDVRQLGDPAVGCEKDFRVTWRCATEEGIRSAVAPGEAGLGSTVALHCSGPVSRRIEVLAATAGPAPISGLTAAASSRCSGRTSCAVTFAELAPLLRSAPEAATVRVHWRCEGEMAQRETTVPAGDTARLVCE